MPHVIDVSVDDAYAEAVDVAAVEAAAQRTLAVVGAVDPVEVSILITGDETLQELNRTYRGQDKPTDVLSFGQGDDDTPPLPDIPRLLGDVVVSYPRAVAQAAQAGWATDDELAWLVIHGVLHLSGYDDESEDGWAEMVALGEQALGKAALHLKDEG